MKTLAFLMSLLWSTAALACPTGDSWQAMALASPDQVAGDLTGYANVQGSRLSQPFDMEVTFCGDHAQDIIRLDVQAVMPAHQHGMNYDPIVAQIGEGQFEVTGMVFHMPGHWQIQVTAYTDPDPLFFTLDVTAR